MLSTQLIIKVMITLLGKVWICNYFRSDFRYLDEKLQQKTVRKIGLWTTHYLLFCSWLGFTVHMALVSNDTKKYYIINLYEIINSYKYRQHHHVIAQTESTDYLIRKNDVLWRSGSRQSMSVQCEHRTSK